jgi:hypothetical protein
MHNLVLSPIDPEKLISSISDRVTANVLNAVKNASQKVSEEDVLLTREETCKFLSIDSSTLWAWTNKGKVKAYGIANRRYYKRSELLECLTPLKK